MSARETPICFVSEGNPLIGIVHTPKTDSEIGILAIVAGGPQYRAGCCRQLVQMARSLAEDGVAVMRFDYHGLGDGDGEYQGFRSIGPDIDAAIAAFIEHAPSVESIVLWGGCDAASASMIHGPYHPKVKGMILGNPYVHSEATAAKAIVKHYYLRRLKEKAFWSKVLRLKFNPLDAMRNVIAAFVRRKGPPENASANGTPNKPFQEQMLDGMKHFEGKILLTMSGLSLVSKEFDELVSSSSEWQAELKRIDVTRVDFPQADQAFSTQESRDDQIKAAREWLSLHSS